MKNKKILYILTFILTLFSFNLNVNAAQELTCVYEKGINNVKVILVQNSSGTHIIYTNKQNAQIKEAGWTRQSDYKLDFDKVTSEKANANSEILSSCPASSEVKEGKNKKITFYSTKKNINEELEKEFLTANIVNTDITPNNANVNIKELTCVYKKGATTRKVILTQNSEGKQTVYTNEKDEAIDGVDWVANKYSINIFNESLNSYGYLDVCPNYANAPHSENKVDFFTYNSKNEDATGNGVDKLFPEKLIESYNEVKEIGKTTSTTPDTNLVPDEELLIPLDPNDGKYTGYCKYKKMLDGGEYHYVQINYGKSDILITEYDPEKKDYKEKNYSGENEHYEKIKISNLTEEEKEKLKEMYGITLIYHEENFSFKIDREYNYAYFLELNEGNCPIGIKVKREYFSGRFTNDTFRHSVNTQILTDTSKGDLYALVDTGGKNPITNEELTLDGAMKPIEFIKVEVENCEDLLGKEVAGYLDVVWNIVKFGVPIILMGMGTVDFVQVVFAGKDDAMKKAGSKFIKRIIIALAIFLVPTLLTFLLDIANSIWGNIGTDLCGILF